MKFQPLKVPAQLVIHRGGTISLRNLVGRKWRRWRHGLTEISERDFKRLLPEEQGRIRRLEARERRVVVVPYEVGPGGVIEWEAKKKEPRQKGLSPKTDDNSPEIKPAKLNNAPQI
jgi:hypothetical protein